MESKLNAESLPNYFGQAEGWKGGQHEKASNPGGGYIRSPVPFPFRRLALRSPDKVENVGILRLFPAIRGSLGGVRDP